MCGLLGCPPEDVLQVLVQQEGAESVGGHFEVVALRALACSADIVSNDTVLYYCTLTCFDLLPAGGVITLALCTNTSSRPSRSRNFLAAGPMVVRSARSRISGSSWPRLSGYSCRIEAMAREIFSSDRVAMYTVPFFSYRILATS